MLWEIKNVLVWIKDQSTMHFHITKAWHVTACNFLIYKNGNIYKYLSSSTNKEREKEEQYLPQPAACWVPGWRPAELQEKWECLGGLGQTMGLRRGAQCVQGAARGAGRSYWMYLTAAASVPALTDCCLKLYYREERENINYEINV